MAINQFNTRKTLIYPFSKLGKRVWPTFPPEKNDCSLGVAYVLDVLVCFSEYKE